MTHVEYRVAISMGDMGDGYYQYERQSFHTPNLAHNFYLSLEDWQHGRIITELMQQELVPF